MATDMEFQTLCGMPVETGGNRPILLTDPDAVFVVRSGEVDVFMVRLKNGRPEGSRLHVFRARAGQVLFDFRPAQGTDVRLEAVGMPGAAIFKTGRSALVNSAGPELLDDLFAGWTSGLLRSIAGALDVPRKHRLVSPGPLDLEVGENLRSEGRLVWIARLDADISLMGEPDLPTVPAGFYIPLPDGAWLSVAEKGKALAVSTPEMLADDPGLSSLDKFHEIVAAALVQGADRAAKEEEERLAERDVTDRTMFQSALAGLGRVLPNQAGPYVLREKSEKALPAVCRIIGRKQGFRVVDPPPEALSGNFEESLAAIARASRVRYREVALEGDWSRGDHGPLLAFRERDRTPVALIPAGRNRYDLHDPVSGRAARVGREEAETLSPNAYAFYPPLPSRAVTGWDLWRLGLRGRGRDLAVIFASGLAAAVLGLAPPVAIGVIFDSVIPEAAGNLLLQITGLLVAAALAGALFDLTKGLAVIRVEGRVDSSVQAAVWDRLLNLPVPFFRKFSAGDLAGRAMGIDAVRQALSGLTVEAVLTAAFSLVYLFLLFYYQAGLAILAIGLTAVGLGAVALAGWLRMRFEMKVYELEGRLSGSVLQFITGAAKLRVSGTEDRAFSFWAERFARQKRLAYRSGTLENFVVTFNAVFPVLTMAAIFAWVASAGRGSLSTGAFLAFNAAFLVFQNAWLQMVLALTAAMGVIPLYRRIGPILETLPETDAAKAHPGPLRGEIEVKSLYFRYTADGPTILKDVSLHVRPGEFVAVVGASGSGKSTLFRLLLGFESLESGGIYYDGQDLSTLDVREVRRQCGVVLQNSGLMQGEIYKNIVGASNATIEDVWEAARMAQIADEIEALPMGMQTVLPAGGGTLSGGQRQRLLIARAIVHRPRILYFDESTSALDNKTQAAINQCLEALRVTRVVIAHRLSTIIGADRIFVVRDGEIVQQGAFDELMAEDGYFVELARRQMV